MEKKLVVFDSNAVLYRSFFALPELTTKEGEKIQAVYGFFRVCLKILKELKPHFLIFCFDFPAKTFRHERLKEYKSTREKIPSDLKSQIEKIKKVLLENSFFVLEKEGFEADDLIASIVKSETVKNLEKIIVTKDRDLFQLIEDKTKVYFLGTKNKDSILFDKEKIEKEYGIEPSFFADFKSLMGDVSDNIKGVEKIGKKTAVNLVKKIGSLEEFFKNEDFWKLEEKERLILFKNKDLILKNLSLIKLEPLLKIDLSLKESEINSIKIEAFKNIFIKLGFKSLLKDLDSLHYP